MAAVFLLAPVGQVAAHPIHTTLTEIRLVRGSGGVVAELRIRAFVDDFSAAVARAVGRTPPRDSSVAPADAASYLARNVALFDGSGRALPLEWCGARREQGVIWVCLRTRPAVQLDQLALRHRMHMEMFSDQVNLVQVVTGAQRSSVLFTRRDGKKTL